MNILITGSCGMLGQYLCKHLAKKNNIFKISKRNIIEDQYLSIDFLDFKYNSIRKLKKFVQPDIIIHAAAIKQVDSAEYNALEYIKTNIYGAENVIEASIYNNVKKVIALSTDKASSPVNLYGGTKLCSDKLFVAANLYVGKNIFSVVRYGNVFGSRGSVIPFFLDLINKKQKLIITDPEMTRFNIDLDDAVKLVVNATKNSVGGEIFVPKISSYRIMDIVKAIQNKKDIKIVGIRPGEKLHEELISRAEGYNTFDLGNFFIIAGNEKSINICKKRKYKKFKVGLNYNSLDNPFLTIAQIKKLIENYKKKLRS